MIQMPPDAISFLRQQRTEYTNDSDLEAQAGFSADVAEFADQLRPYLPAHRPEMRFIDIGCGIGFGLLGLLSIYGPEHSFVGVDRGVPDVNIRYGFSDAPSAYNSLRLTRDILTGAGVAADRIACVDIDVEPFPSGTADVVTSTYAWGFHFPVQAYLEQAKAALRPDGVIIIDLRRGWGQEAVLERHFNVVHALPGPADKCDRLVLERKST